MAKNWGEDFDNKLRAKFGLDVQRLEPYVNKRTRIKFRHKCGNEYYAVPSGVLNSKVGSCTKCRTKNTGRRKKTDADFEEQVKELVGDEYTFLDPYTRAHDKIRCRHNKCGTVWSVKPNAFLNGTRCPNIDCIPKKPYKSRAQIEKEVRDKTGDEYRMAEPYKGDGEKIFFVHRYCGYKWKVKPNDILNGHKCPKCTKQLTWNTEKLASYIRVISNGEYELLGEYTGMLKPVAIRHNRCGNVLMMQPESFRAGHRCRECMASNGETWISYWLREKSIQYVSQKEFDGCKDKRSLPFDFYLPSYNLAIEYDGKQHFEPTKFFGGEEAYQYLHKHDLLKNQYCKNNNINLLRIPYTVTGDAIGDVISNKIKQLNTKVFS